MKMRLLTAFALAVGLAPIRTGLTKVGLPGAPEGLYPEDPTLADLLVCLRGRRA